MCNERELKTDEYGRFIRDGEQSAGEDFVQVPMDEYERLKDVEACWNRSIERTTARTLVELQHENRILKAQLNNCATCPYKQAVQSMVKTAKS